MRWQAESTREVRFYRWPRDHQSFSEHDRLAAAISQRDAAAAARAMRLHLESVEAKLLRVHETAD